MINRIIPIGNHAVRYRGPGFGFQEVDRVFFEPFDASRINILDAHDNPGDLSKSTIADTFTDSLCASTSSTHYFDIEGTSARWRILGLDRLFSAFSNHDYVHLNFYMELIRIAQEYNPHKLPPPEKLPNLHVFRVPLSNKSYIRMIDSGRFACLIGSSRSFQEPHIDDRVIRQVEAQDFETSPAKGPYIVPWNDFIPRYIEQPFIGPGDKEEIISYLHEVKQKFSDDTESNRWCYLKLETNPNDSVWFYSLLPFSDDLDARGGYSRFTVELIKSLNNIPEYKDPALSLDTCFAIDKRLIKKCQKSYANRRLMIVCALRGLPPDLPPVQQNNLVDSIEALVERSDNIQFFIQAKDPSLRERFLCAKHSKPILTS